MREERSRRELAESSGARAEAEQKRRQREKEELAAQLRVSRMVGNVPVFELALVMLQLSSWGCKDSSLLWRFKLSLLQQEQSDGVDRALSSE